jgi:hypothetical protein
MYVSVALKSFLTSVGTGGCAELFKMFLLYMNQSTQNVVIFGGIFGYSISYIAQRYIFCGGRFFGLSLLKFFSVSLVTIQLSAILLDKLENIKMIKKYTEDKNISDTKRKLYKYLLINTAILIIFFCIELPLRESFIFLKNKEIDYKYSYTLIGLGILIYIINNNITSISITANSSSASTIANMITSNTIGNNIYTKF